MGVLSFDGGGFGSLNLGGVVRALGADAIVFDVPTGHRFPQADWIALSMAFVARLFLPLGIAESDARLSDPTTLVLVSALAVFSPLPYALELIALRHLPASTFSTTMSLEPAIASTAGFLVRNQTLSAMEFMAIALVIAASAGLCGRGRGGGKAAVPEA